MNLPISPHDQAARSDAPSRRTDDESRDPAATDGAAFSQYLQSSSPATSNSASGGSEPGSVPSPNSGESSAQPSVEPAPVQSSAEPAADAVPTGRAINGAGDGVPVQDGASPKASSATGQLPGRRQPGPPQPGSQPGTAQRPSGRESDVPSDGAPPAGDGLESTGATAGELPTEDHPLTVASVDADEAGADRATVAAPIVSPVERSADGHHESERSNSRTRPGSPAGSKPYASGSTARSDHSPRQAPARQLSAATSGAAADPGAVATPTALPATEATLSEFVSRPITDEPSGTVVSATESAPAIGPATGSASGETAPAEPAAAAPADPIVARDSDAGPQDIAGQDSTGPISRAARMRLVQRVARAMLAHPRDGGIIRMRLHPPELGSLRLEVSVERGALTARLKTETEMARQVLLDQLPALRQRLEQMGMRMEQFDVHVGQHDGGGRQAFDQSRPDVGQPRRAEVQPVSRSAPSPTAGSAEPVGRRHAGHLNIII